SWVQTDLGSGTCGMYEVAVGDGNNDGEIEVYGAGGYIYQFKWAGTSWGQTDFGSGLGTIKGVAVGDGNNDGEIEVYGANEDNHIYQFKWDGAAWEVTDLGSGVHWMADVVIGDGDNDGEIEVYGANLNNFIYQFKQTTVPDIVVTPDTVVIETSWLKEGTRNSSSKEIEKKTAIKLELIGLSSDTNPTGTMVVYNKGLGELEVSDITPIASWISEISPNNFVLSPEDSQVVVVTADISGLSPGTYRTHLFINSNDPDESTYIVRVKLIITYLTVTSIVPESGVDNGITDIIGIFGSNFDLGAAVKLVRGGLPDIIADNVNVISSNKITCSFDLNGETTGVRDVIVTNIDGSADTLPMAFTVNGFISPPYTWEVKDMGFSDFFIAGVSVGDGNNDGEVEVYGVIQAGAGCVYQFKWDGASWVQTELGSGGAWMNGVSIGDGNNDGEIEVYVASGFGHVYQFKWDGASWERTDLGSGEDEMSDVAIGDGNNDGEIEVYGASGFGHVYQFKRDVASWVRTELGFGGSWMQGVAVGDGNNDGEIEVYGANYDTHIYQFKWDSTSWVQSALGSGGDEMLDVAVGDGNNDGEIEIYCTNADNHIYQFKWDGASWEKTDLGSGGVRMVRVAVGDGNNDGEIEVYCANYDYHIYQFKWDGASWVQTDLGSGGHSMADVATGDGNNDGEIEVYGANSDGHIYQFKVFTDQGIMEKEVTPKVFFLFQNYPNPFVKSTNIKFCLPKDSYVNINIYNLSGQRVATLIDEHKVVGYYEINWDGLNDKGMKLEQGVYFYHLETEVFKSAKKIILLR
ncbi:T9SS type A sorting domain-containing protein, partial [candidate division WOR-3 bacterium]|nr:T9SS type A sorting domain-containing protein [candidate division WOR-3 bacterium]